MAERAVTEDAITAIHDSVIVNPSQPNFQSGTYVVQVPKDQIYRIPPPENELIARRHRTTETNNQTQRCCCCSCCMSCCITIIVLVVVIALLLGLGFYFFNPKNPSFQVERLVVSNSIAPSLKNKSRSNPDFAITLEVRNPNWRSSVYYEQDGVTTLSFEGKKIAVGKFPTFHQDHRNFTDVGIVLKSSQFQLPKELENSMESNKSKVEIWFSLEMNVPAIMKTSILTSGAAKLVVTCDISVDTLSKGTRILSQECKTDR